MAATSEQKADTESAGVPHGDHKSASTASLPSRVPIARQTQPGSSEYAADAIGYGNYPGQYGMVLLSKHPISIDQVRTFQKFLWRDMPGALLPDRPETASPSDWYSPDALEVLRLSSKSHWDVPVRIGDRTVHFLASHPTPPVFDGLEDHNGRRNHDEIRFWADYLTPASASYIRDDRGDHGGLDDSADFVVLGDLNADPADGAPLKPILKLLEHPRVGRFDPPRSARGALEGRQGVNVHHQGDPALDTGDFPDDEKGPGNLRIDFVLPSAELRVVDSGVFWPNEGDPLDRLVGRFPFPSSDHRMVWVDIVLP